MSIANGSESAGAGEGRCREWRRRLVEPLCGLLGGGLAPASLAWALAVGVLIGVMPLVWGTSLLCLGCALLLRLNPLAVQVGNFAAWPLQLLFAYPYLRLGSAWFGIWPGEVAGSGLLGTLVRANGLALVAWALTAPLLLPLLYAASLRLVVALGSRLARRAADH